MNVQPTMIIPISGKQVSAQMSSGVLSQPYHSPDLIEADLQFNRASEAVSCDWLQSFSDVWCVTRRPLFQCCKDLPKNNNPKPPSLVKPLYAEVSRDYRAEHSHNVFDEFYRQEGGK